MLDFLYQVRGEERRVFGKNWCGPEDSFKPWEETLVARYPGEGDGQPVDVYCTAGPARFFTIKALEGKNSVGEVKKPWSLGTGSSEGELAAKIALAISRNMLDLNREAT